MSQHELEHLGHVQTALRQFHDAVGQLEDEIETWHKEAQESPPVVTVQDGYRALLERAGSELRVLKAQWTALKDELDAAHATIAHLRQRCAEAVHERDLANARAADAERGLAAYIAEAAHK